MKVPKSVKLVYVWGKGSGLFANRGFKEGETVIAFKADVVDRARASEEAVQIDANKFYDTKWLVPEAFINHSCSPNVRLDVAGKRYVAIRNINKNEEVTFDYNTTEWDMVKYGDDFQCHCGSSNCIRRVRGLKYLSRAQQRKLKPFLSPYLSKKFIALMARSISREKLVKGEGPQNAKIIFIGEAPGKDEEKQGRPFVGRAGKFLRASLQKLGIDSSKTYITNVVKVRPKTKTGANRKPTPAEIKKFMPKLNKELLRLKPKVIVLLGDTALKVLLGEKFKISKHHGKIVKKRDGLYFISYHPAAAFRSRKMRMRFLKDLKKLQR